MRMIAAMWGAEVEEPPSRHAQPKASNKNNEKLLPAYAIDPLVGGEARPLYTEEDIYSLPINIGYGIIKRNDE